LDVFTMKRSKRPAVRERVKMELLNRHLEVSKRGALQEEPCIIKAWKGYTPPGREDMLTRISKVTRGSPYEVDLREKDLEQLVQFAASDKNKDNDHIVTILPYNRLTDTQVDRLTKAEARVIFMDLEKEELSADDVNHIGGIIAAGIAYLNNNDFAFTNIYKLLTDDYEHAPISVEEFKKDPSNLKFLLKPIEIKDAEDLRDLYERMEELLIAA